MKRQKYARDVAKHLGNVNGLYLRLRKRSLSFQNARKYDEPFAIHRRFRRFSSEWAQSVTVALSGGCGDEYSGMG